MVGLIPRGSPGCTRETARISASYQNIPAIFKGNGWYYWAGITASFGRPGRTAATVRNGRRGRTAATGGTGRSPNGSSPDEARPPDRQRRTHRLDNRCHTGRRTAATQGETAGRDARPLQWGTAGGDARPLHGIAPRADRLFHLSRGTHQSMTPGRNMNGPRIEKFRPFKCLDTAQSDGMSNTNATG